MIKLTLNNSTELEKIAFIVNREPYIVRRSKPISLELDNVNFVGVEARECEGDFINCPLFANVNFRCVKLGNKLHLSF